MRKQTFTTKPNNKISTLFVITVRKSIISLGQVWKFFHMAGYLALC